MYRYKPFIFSWCLDWACAGEDYPIFLKCMPLYFPRTKQDEESAKTLLPENTGNDSGEVVLEERDIRISAIPGAFSKTWCGGKTKIFRQTTCGTPNLEPWSPLRYRGD